MDDSVYEEKKPGPVRRVLKILALVLIFLGSALVIWRVFLSARTPGEIDTVLPTPALKAAYAESGAPLAYYWQEQYTTTLADYNYGYFTVPKGSARFFPDAEELQLVFRYNNSTLESLAKDYGLPETPPKSGDYYDLSVVIRYLDGSVRRFFPAEEHKRAETLMYTFYLCAFPGVVVDDSVEGVFLDIYYKEAVDYEQNAYGTLCLWSRNEKYDYNRYETLSGKQCNMLK